MNDHQVIVALGSALLLSMAANIWAYRQFWRVARALEEMRARTLQVLGQHVEGPHK